MVFDWQAFSKQWSDHNDDHVPHGTSEEQDLASNGLFQGCSVKSIDISGNSLVCDCQIEWLVEFFNGSSPTLLHKEDTFCSPSSASLEPLRGKPFATFEYDKYCGLDTRLILGISVGVFAIFALSISFIISYHYRWFLGYK